MILVPEDENADDFLKFLRRIDVLFELGAEAFPLGKVSFFYFSSFFFKKNIKSVVF